jgi:tetratricopeptide (TPR) repeat protein
MPGCSKLTSTWRTVWQLCLLVAGLAVTSASAADLVEAQKLFRTGQYESCVAACEKAEPNFYQIEDWRLLHGQALLAIGRYPQAHLVISNALINVPRSVRLRWLAIETGNYASSNVSATQRLQEINELVGARSWAYSESADLVALGRAALRLGVDPKTVLERLYNRAQTADPKLRDVWLAPGELALQKRDFALAAKTFTEALKQIPDDPDLLFGLAQAYQPNARPKMLELVQTALGINENHVPSILLLADHAVDAEQYEQADELLTRALKVNPWHPEAWAYRAVLAHLQNNSVAEADARANGLKFWKANPQVDHLIGRKLSQKYRFAEGAGFQRQALVFDSDYLPAKMQLAEDLLRLGDDEGWKLAETVHQHDAYDVTAYNLVTLQSTMRKFAAVTNEHFVIRMSEHEAALYGERALALLETARTRLTEKYGVELEAPTYIEIFPEQKDFGVRTFGMPHNPGFLGVCFGRVVTANSPASQGGNPSNWEAVLWHEFAHVVTLQMTKNKMPRWLSEGISVFEELEANPAWGQVMNPRYREMVLGEDLTPVSELSSVFMTAKSDMHVQFAYYQSALVVEYLVGKFGFDKLKAILRDLAEGVDINDAITKHTAPMRQIEREFEAFAKAKAEALGPGLDWTKKETDLTRRLARNSASFLFVPNPTSTNPPPYAEASPRQPVPAVAESHPEPAPETPSPTRATKPNYWTLLEQAQQALTDKNWAAAKTPLQTLVTHYPDQSGGNNAYAMLAAVHRGLNETAAERVALEQWAAREADAADAYLRLMELAEQAQDWKVVAQNAERYLAVNPLVPSPYRFLAAASEALGETQPAIGAYQKLLRLDPADPADVHFRLARLMHSNNDPAAKRQVLQALEEAPRFRAAHQLLLELAQTETTSTNVPSNPTP